MREMESILIFGFLTSLFLCLSLIAKTSKACHGYEMTNFHYEVLNTEDPEMAVKLSPDFGLELDKECQMRTKGCIEFPATTELKMCYHVYKKGLLDEKEDVDGCEMLDEYSDNPQMACLLKILGGAAQCPIEEKKVVCNHACGMGTNVKPAQIQFAEGVTDIWWKICPDEKCTELVMNLTVSKV